MTLALTSDSLELLHVRKRYAQSGGHQPALDVLEDISLQVRGGEFVSIVGASGCGKSTLLRLIAGLDVDYEGEIRAGGERVRDTSLQRGIVFQDHRLFPWLTVAQNVEAALRNSPLDARARRAAVAEHIALVGLAGFEAAYPSQLSGGMAQRVAIARGLVNRPRLLLLDEPFGALDAQTRTRMQHELQRIWEQERITMILVTHDVDEAVWLGERVITMAPRPGRIARITEVALPRPRERHGSAFARLRDGILAELGDDEAAARTAPPPREAPRPAGGWRLAW
ncbi:sulfonate ABC transporter ATP-binding protein [Burkholderia gladioli]|uniref:ABC transporter ATP-binding protein n=1 Tax=Burkholderia gladioli TaxID=28095 RepID=UPI00075616BD|nr:ABC transporter ATP-binding protein [Burkholderia gladioli]KVM69675.1 sulfonate ABC transporter ATP-binding protein [Burkholderia gladioli]